MYHSPIVLQPTSLLALLDYVVRKHAEPSEMVICSSKEVFLHNLLKQTKEKQEEDIYDFSTPTLQLLKASCTLDMTFIPSLRALHAWLCQLSTKKSSYSNDQADEQDSHSIGRKQSRTPMLVIVSPISLHRETSAFSAQGLSRAFAAMVEAAFRIRKKLIIAECSFDKLTVVSPSGIDAPGNEDDEETMIENPPEHGESAGTNPWDEDVSILNVTTKSFGAGERGWVGRTVKIRHIANRWCRFETIPSRLHSG